MNSWLAFALGIFVGSTFSTLMLGIMLLGARTDERLRMAIERELDEQEGRAAKWYSSGDTGINS